MKCSQCSSQAALLFKTKDYNRALSPDIFDYYRCRQCKCIFLSKIPPNLGDYYPSNYYEIPTDLEKFVRHARKESYKIDIIRRFKTEGRLLEIGPAFGSFCYLAKDAGFHTEAIEMDASCCNFLKDSLGIEAIQSDCAEIALKSLAPYDVVALWHVIEHLPNPWSTLEAIIQKLNPGGILVVAAPNPDALQFKLFKKHWTHVDAPRHLNLIPIELLCKKVEAEGLKNCFSTTADRGGIGWNRFGWAFSLSNFSKQPLLKKTLHLSGKVISRLIAPIEQRAYRGSAYTLVFQKEG